jgi:sporulation protein YlmC with PRC-barrel domain
MKDILKASDVRREWSRFIDEVKWVKPALVKRYRDIIAVLSLEQLEFILEKYKFTVEVKKEEDGSYTGVLSEIDLMANAGDMESLKLELARELVEYSKEYMNEFGLYYGSPNRKGHFPYVFRVLLVSDNIEKIKEMLFIKLKSYKKVI